MLQVEGVEEAESDEERNEAETAAAEEQRAMEAAAAAAGATFVDTAGAQQRTEPAGQPALIAYGWGLAVAVSLSVGPCYPRLLRAGLHAACLLCGVAGGQQLPSCVSINPFL